MKLHVPPVRGISDVQAYSVPSSSCVTFEVMVSSVAIVPLLVILIERIPSSFLTRYIAKYQAARLPSVGS